jgi:hypothetical protein
VQQIRFIVQNKKTPDLERLLICNPKMVRLVDSRWNQVYAGLMLMYVKLDKLGFTYRDGGVGC